MQASNPPTQSSIGGFRNKTFRARSIHNAPTGNEGIHAKKGPAIKGSDAGPKNAQHRNEPTPSTRSGRKAGDVHRPGRWTVPSWPSSIEFRIDRCEPAASTLRCVAVMMKRDQRQ